MIFLMTPVTLIYRKPNPRFFSIEKVFSVLLPYMPEEYVYDSYELPFFSSVIKCIIKNILAVRKLKSIVHITGDVHYVILGTSAQKSILTIHDCVFMYRNKGVKRFILCHDYDFKMNSIEMARCKSTRNYDNF